LFEVRILTTSFQLVKYFSKLFSLKKLFENNHHATSLKL
jgi:hypothetical protein